MRTKRQRRELTYAYMTLVILGILVGGVIYAAHQRSYNRPKGFYPNPTPTKQDVPGARFPVGVPVYPVTE